MVPFATVACQSRRLYAKHSTHFAAAYFTHQVFESRALNQSTSRTSQILIYRRDLGKAQLTCTLDQTILEALALLIVDHLHRL
jgi:hypothetical protein